MKIKQFYIYLADLSPEFGTEPGKTRPVIVIQTDLLNDSHFSTLICPITTSVKSNVDILRVHLTKTESGLKENSDILIDQIRAIDNRRFIKKIGQINIKHKDKIMKNLQIILFE